MNISNEVEKAYQLAKEVQKNAYAKYSNFLVGATIKIKGENKYFSGCNVENASFGATICAERNAIWSSIATLGKKEFEFIVLVTDTDPCIPPCAMCLQVMAEFCDADMPIYLSNNNEIQKKVLFKNLLTTPFGNIPETI